MNTAPLKKFAQAARRQLMEQVAARLKIVLQYDSAELRQQEKAINQLKTEIERTSQAAVVERVAYTWFNRFCALRFMDVNRYTTIGVVSPTEGFLQPEILQEAKQGHIDEELRVDSKRVLNLLGGRISAANPQQEAYRLLLVAECNRLSRNMPFMFQQINDYTELLMPDDLLSEQSILAAVREALNEESCQDVEVIGWLYQFYVSEKKDQVFEGLKNNKKITPENIPAATQLFTPHWIVRYLVENSLGRLWMLNRPGSNLTDQMDYYIRPEEPETDFLKVASPEELKICDPACGSGHMLTYAFDLLYLIYEEEGYDAKEIPQLILTKNLYGIEIDERAGELAAFALTMKARGKYKRFFRKVVQPNICVLQNVTFTGGELKPYIEAVGRDLFTMNLQTLLHQFEEADNFGSLIRPVVEDVGHIRQVIKEKRVGEQLALSPVHPRVMRVLEQTEYLSSRYHVVVANPPYMGSKGMNARLAAWAKDYYPDSKADLFAMFIERNFNLAKTHGVVAMVTMQSWMFLSSFEKLRSNILGRHGINSLIQIGYNSFPELNSKVAQAAAFLIQVNGTPTLSEYLNLNDAPQAASKDIVFKEKLSGGHLFRVHQSEFSCIPGCPIAYWATDAIKKAFSNGKTLERIANPRQGMKTLDNDRFIRFWYEVSWCKTRFDCQKPEDSSAHGKWFPLNHGGEYRRWFGNNYYVVNWENDGSEIKRLATETYNSVTRTVTNIDSYFKPGITWTVISSGNTSFRCFPKGFLFSNSGQSLIPDHERLLFQISGFLNSKVSIEILKILSPTLGFESGYLKKMPIIDPDEVGHDIAQQNIEAAKIDWDSFETSWDFDSLPLLNHDYRKQTLEDTWEELRSHWLERTLSMKQREEENNRIFINSYGLQDELMPELSLKEITLSCNPHYRYGKDKSEGELEVLFLADTMREFLSYAVGCMLGRYSLDKPSLILVNQGETLADYLKQIPKPTFMPDEDNVIPILDDDWFMDDIVARFRTFLKTTFGEEHYEENLKFIEDAIGKDIRKFFLKDFYTDHIKRYKKRPIYWLFSSPKGSFNALIYMHRYRADTVSIILNDYLREFRTKLSARKEHLEQVSISSSASNAEKSRALKEIEKIKKTIDELREYEDDILYPLATEKIEIDLDDGVKVNYPKFGKALKNIPGLS